MWRCVVPARGASSSWLTEFVDQGGFTFRRHGDAARLRDMVKLR